MSVDPFTDSAIASRVRNEVLDGEFIYVPGLGWLHYSAGTWSETPTELVLEALRSWAETQFLDAVASRASQETLKGWTRWQATVRLQAALTLCRGMCHVPATKLDAHPDLLNTRNGVVDLRTGELKAHSPWFYFTKVTGCEFDPKATHADWDAALSALPDSVLTWCQTRYGQGITGHPAADHTCVIQVGGGANGKSTLMHAFRAALGSYYLASTERLLLPAARDAITPEVADLRGARFVAIEETPETGRLDTQRLKTLVGTPTITARRLYQDYITFDASHTLFLNTNFAPIVNETDHGTWRRLLLLVFPYTFTPTPLEPEERLGDPEIVNRLRLDDQKRAVLAWLVAGAVRWYADGYGPVPHMVESDTADWRGSVDHVAAFWDEYLVRNADACIAVTDMMRRFNEFMRDVGASSMAEGTFARRFREHPRTKAAGVYPSKVRNSAGLSAKFSRPHRDEYSQLPPLPDGVLRAWRGVAFRPRGGDVFWHSVDGVDG